MPTEANSLNAQTVGIVGNTGTAFTGTAATQYNILSGGASTSTLNNIAPSSTSGIPLVSNGSSSQPSFTTALVPGGGTGLITTTAYGLITGGTTATGNFQNAGTGTSGQYYKSGGASALGTWTSTSSIGNLVLIQSQTASSSSTLTFTTGITATYNNYMVVISNYKASTSQNLLLQISTNGGSSYISSGYSGGVNQSVWNSATLLNSNLTIGFLLGFSVTTTQPTNGVVYLQNFTSGTGYPMCQGQLVGVFNTNFGTCILSSLYDTASTTVNAFQIGPSTGTLSTGTFTLYGILE